MCDYTLIFRPPILLNLYFFLSIRCSNELVLFDTPHSRVESTRYARSRPTM